MVTVETR